MSIRQIVLGSVLASAALLVAGRLAVQAPASTGVVVTGSAGAGQPAPRVQLPDFQGNPVRLADFRGQPVVVNFWASWCPSCIAEMPDFEKVHKRLGGRVAFLGINQRDDRAAAEELARSTGVTYQLAIDEAGRSFDAFRGLGMPTTVLIAPDGTVAEVISGPLDEMLLRERLQAAFGVT